MIAEPPNIINAPPTTPQRGTRIKPASIRMTISLIVKDRVISVLPKLSITFGAGKIATQRMETAKDRIPNTVVTPENSAGRKNPTRNLPPKIRKTKGTKDEAKRITVVHRKNDQESLCLPIVRMNAVEKNSKNASGIRRTSGMKMYAEE